MQVLTATSTGAIGAGQGWAFRGLALNHSAPASAVLLDGGSRVLGRATVGDASGGADGFMLPGPIPAVGLNVSVLTAGATLEIYVE